VYKFLAALSFFITIRLVMWFGTSMNSYATADVVCELIASVAAFFHVYVPKKIKLHIARLFGLPTPEVRIMCPNHDCRRVYRSGSTLLNGREYPLVCSVR
jgi:hypothetical protein